MFKSILILLSFIGCDAWSADMADIPDQKTIPPKPHALSAATDFQSAPQDVEVIAIPQNDASYMQATAANYLDNTVEPFFLEMSETPKIVPKTYGDLVIKANEILKKVQLNYENLKKSYAKLKRNMKNLDKMFCRETITQSDMAKKFLTSFEEMISRAEKENEWFLQNNALIFFVMLQKNRLESMRRLLELQCENERICDLCKGACKGGPYCSIYKDVMHETSLTLGSGISESDLKTEEQFKKLAGLMAGENSVRQKRRIDKEIQRLRGQMASLSACAAPSITSTGATVSKSMDPAPKPVASESESVVVAPDPVVLSKSPLPAKSFDASVKTLKNAWGKMPKNDSSCVKILKKWEKLKKLYGEQAEPPFIQTARARLAEAKSLMSQLEKPIVASSAVKKQPLERNPPPRPQSAGPVMLLPGHVFPGPEPEKPQQKEGTASVMPLSENVAPKSEMEESQKKQQIQQIERPLPTSPGVLNTYNRVLSMRITHAQLGVMQMLNQQPAPPNIPQPFSQSVYYVPGACAQGGPLRIQGRGRFSTQPSALDLFHEAITRYHSHDAVKEYAALIFRIGQEYHFGQYRPQNIPAAENAYRCAAHWGHPQAAHNLGAILFSTRREKEALKFFQFAATQDVREAQHMLATYYQYGLGGVRQNQKLAKALSCALQDSH